MPPDATSATTFPKLDAGRRLSQALVHAEAEGHVAPGIAVDVQPVRIVERSGVTIADVVGDDHPVEMNDRPCRLRPFIAGMLGAGPRRWKRKRRLRVHRWA
ncbi:hypothetical protein GCM10010251_27960 [Streptomyces aurantiogriseus]|uniref:Uncharacterized protein n=1 Tax=Streptomyces aurantiogriseus TaxID=66870 RepID=A0A918C799_9ACTN|nr:hypothetical protein GCM10010251_27960 [Streptomyces aurantiogriseus]